jgi:RNA polymerase sigma-70 factor (ECF subfamily)
LHAFAALFERFQDCVCDLAWAILRDEAEDAVQDTFLRLFERIDRYQGASPFQIWLVAVTVNVCRDRFRRRKVRRALPLEWLGPVAGRGEDPVEVVQRQEQRSSLVVHLSRPGSFLL